MIYISRNSNVTGDQPTPTATGESNLSTGSSSPLDPFLGTVQLPVGTSKTYYVAISSDAMLPTDLSQTFLPAAGQPRGVGESHSADDVTTASLLDASSPSTACSSLSRITSTPPSQAAPVR